MIVKSGEKVAVKLQFPNAERLMTGDLRNLRFLAEFLQRTDLKFDLLSAIKELQKQIVNEFDFTREAQNMAFMQKQLCSLVPEVTLPRPIWATKKALVMTFVEGQNLCRLAEFRKQGNAKDNFITKKIKQKYGKKLLDILAKAWGEQIFTLRFFNAGINFMGLS
jgi:predicted unusual protein kinase regulating ubiquinone biosynthesis (AarF/ABC1/UbiB family)